MYLHANDAILENNSKFKLKDVVQTRCLAIYVGGDLAS